MCATTGSIILVKRWPVRLVLLSNAPFPSKLDAHACFYQRLLHTMFRKTARYICKTEACKGSFGAKFIRVHMPGARETQTVRFSYHYYLFFKWMQAEILMDFVLIGCYRKISPVKGFCGLDRPMF